VRRIRIPSRIQSICVTSIHHSSLEWPSRALCLGFPGAGSSVEAASPTALQQVIGCQLRCTRFPTRVVLQPTGESLVYGCLNRTDGHFRAYGQTLRYSTREIVGYQLRRSTNQDFVSSDHEFRQSLAPSQGPAAGYDRVSSS
jgi:hypothetical protein